MFPLITLLLISQRNQIRRNSGNKSVERLSEEPPSGGFGEDRFD